MSECVCVSLWPACHSYPTPCNWHTPPSSGACCLHLCGNPTMSTMQHKSDNAVVVLSDSGGKSCAAGSPPFAAPAPAPALSCCVVPHKNSSFLAFSLCYATSHSSTSTPAPALFHFSPASGCFFMSAICIGRFVDVFCTFAFSALRRGGKRREERLRGSGRERGELEREAAYKNNDIKMRIILKPDCPIC